MAEKTIIKGSNTYYPTPCLACGKVRLVRKIKGNPESLYCRDCFRRQNHFSRTGENATNWREGEFLDANGYRRIYAKNKPEFLSMMDTKGYILEHRLVMAQSLGRCLERWEAVHHKNRIRADNRLSNLSLVLIGRHSGGISCPYCHRSFEIL